MNHLIRLTPIRLIGPDNEQIGVIETPDAMRMAQEHGLDLVEIVPDARPPVCKIMDYGKHKYEESKKEQKSRASGKQAELKEIRLGRSTKIDPHDIQIRCEQARRFLMDGHKVQVTQRFRGREMAHRELGMENLHKFYQDLSDIAKIELEPRWVGRQTSIVLAPDRNKIDAIKRKQAKEQAEQEAAAQAENADEAPEERKKSATAVAEEARLEEKREEDEYRQLNPVDAEIDAILGD